MLINIGSYNKTTTIKKYFKANPKITRIYVFYPEKFKPNIEIEGIDIEYIEYKDIIRYVYFYRLLQEIDNNSLLVFNEIMRTQNRYDLTYNCCHHYCNQTPHKIIFETYPFIDQPEDFMILLDLIDKNKYRGNQFSYEYLNEDWINIAPIHHTLETINLSLESKDINKYNKERDKLFDNIGMKDPDTIPRQLHVWAGQYKKKVINQEKQYVARNARFKNDNIKVYKDIKDNGDYTVIDFPHRRIDFNDFLKTTEIKNIKFINSGLKVDQYYINDLRDWINRLEDFYVEAGVYNQNR